VPELFPALRNETTKIAVRFGDTALNYADLAALAGALATRLREAAPAATTPPRVAVWATASPETVVATLAALLAGTPAIPINPRSGEQELTHILADSEPALVLTAPDTPLPDPLANTPVWAVDLSVSAPAQLPTTPDPETTALIIYTSGTTGVPKGVMLPHRAITSSLDAIAEVWHWGSEDVLAHALPLFHVHGLILGVLGALRRGSTVIHLGRFDTTAVRTALAERANMLFAVPTMYHRIADALPDDPALTDALRRAWLLVSGSAALPVHDHERITAATGQRVVERYGLSETLMNTSVRLDSPPKAGTVGFALPGVSLRLRGERGEVLETHDAETIGEIEVSGPNLFTGYLNRPDATAEVFDGTWFATGDMATRDADGYIRIVGRKSTDIINSGGHKIGAVEIENALLEHHSVAEAAVTAEPDPDLGERVVAWIVPRDSAPDTDEIAAHVARLLAPHKRPREIRTLRELPRNDMGKVRKRALTR